MKNIFIKILLFIIFITMQGKCFALNHDGDHEILEHNFEKLSGKWKGRIFLPKDSMQFGIINSDYIYDLTTTKY